MARAQNIGRSTTQSRLKQPVNPSVRGTTGQSGHENKGPAHSTTGQSEGSGQRRGGGRGGRTSGHKR